MRSPHYRPEPSRQDLPAASVLISAGQPAAPSPAQNPTQVYTYNKPLSELTILELWENKEFASMFSRLGVLFDQNEVVKKQVRHLDSELLGYRQGAR
jgi:hypothetical protein